MSYSWVPLMGEFEQKKDSIIFKGGQIEVSGVGGPSKGAQIGNILCDKRFTDGEISVEIQFSKISPNSICEIILYHDSNGPNLLNAGIGGAIGSMFSIRYFHEKNWDVFSQAGNRGNLKANHKYQLRIKKFGNKVVVNIDGIDVCQANIPFNFPSTNVGIFCIDFSSITITNFQVVSELPKAFVIMQFTPPYNELHEEVIKKVCDEFKIQAVRADDTFGPGLIIADIIKDLYESLIVIAEISPSNPNVYYELGYAHAINKPTILIAEKGTKLPFDVSPFRTLFYENSIAGKNKVEMGLRKHINAILK